MKTCILKPREGVQMTIRSSLLGHFKPQFFGCLFFPVYGPAKLLGNVPSLRLHHWAENNRTSKDACVPTAT